jgi:hypothetical protein
MKPWTDVVKRHDDIMSSELEMAMFTGYCVPVEAIARAAQ